MKKIAIFIAVVVVLLLGATPAYAVPALPHAFYGSVTVNGAPAPDGTQVSATVDSGSVITNAYNPTTTVDGSYGDGSSPYLLVQGDITPGATITFHVNGYSTGRTAAFEAGGGPTELNLTVTISAGDGVGGVGVAPPAGPTAVEANLFGGTVEFSIDNEGVIQETFTATSEDGNLTMTIPEGTVALDKDGNPLEGLEAAVDESPPDPPEDANIIGLAYDFGPDGATFEPPITFTWSYDPDALPEGVAEEDLVIAYYDEDAGEWVELPSTVDPVTHTITASVSHFTTFAIIGAVTPPPPPAPAAFSLSNLTVQPAEVQPKEAVTITVSLSNTGGTEGSYTVVLKINGVKETEQSITIAADASKTVTFIVAKEAAGRYNVAVDGMSGSFVVVAPAIAPPPPAPAPVPSPAPAPPAPPPPAPTPVPPAPNWPLIGGLIAASVVLGLLIFFLIRRRAE